MAANGVEYSKIAVEYYASWETNVYDRHERCKCPTVDLKVTEELRRVKNHLISAYRVGQRSAKRVQPQCTNYQYGLNFAEIASISFRVDNPKISIQCHQG